MYNEGISTMGDIIDLGVSMDIIAKRGSFYSFGDVRLGQGRENAKTFLDENEALAAEIEVQIRNNAGLSVVNFAAGDGDVPEIEGADVEEVTMDFAA